MSGELKEYTESNLNKLSDNETVEKFNTAEYQILIVAEKYQTGPDQPVPAHDLCGYCLTFPAAYKEDGAPILGFASHDMDSEVRGGWRYTICLLESDISDVQAFLKHHPYIETIDASKWVIFESAREDSFDGHSVCMKLGYTWNGNISGSFSVYPDGKIGKPEIGRAHV